MRMARLFAAGNHCEHASKITVQTTHLYLVCMCFGLVRGTRFRFARPRLSRGELRAGLLELFSQCSSLRLGVRRSSQRGLQLSLHGRPTVRLWWAYL